MRSGSGSRRAQATQHETDLQIRAELGNSVSWVRLQALMRDDGGEQDGYDALVGVATAADQKISERKVSRQVSKDFGCYECLRVIKADAAAPASVHVTVEHWQGWRDPFSGPESWRQIRLRCRECAAPDREEAAASRKRTREKNELRACDQSRRLRARSANAAVGEFAMQLQALSVEQLKAVCAANAVLKSGRKQQLIERLVGVWSFGSLPHCPACMGRCIELQYAGGSSTPTMVQCKHMRGKGKPCGFSQRLAEESMSEVLTAPLRDSTEGDLASLGVALGR